MTKRARRTLTIAAFLGILPILILASPPCAHACPDVGPGTQIQRSAEGGPFSQNGAVPESTQHGDPFAAVFRALAVIVCCAAVGRYCANKLKQSPVLGEMAVGIIVGAGLFQLKGCVNESG